jgi:ribonuclease HI
MIGKSAGEMPSEGRLVEVWTDGGCQGNPGPGAWAFVLRERDELIEKSGFDPRTTNNRMELTAVREALSAIAARGQGKSFQVVISTDSQYVQKGITEWIRAWSRNGWKTSAKKPVKNSDLWLSLLELSRGLPVQWLWVMGHAGNEMNERCDSLVQAAIAAGAKRGD